MSTEHTEYIPEDFFTMLFNYNSPLNVANIILSSLIWLLQQ